MIQESTYKSSDYMRPALVTVIIFAIVGPPIGNLVLAALLPVFVFATGQETEFSGVLERVPAIFRMFASSIPQSYGSGGMQAFATGLFLSGYGVYRGRPTIVRCHSYSELLGLGLYYSPPEETCTKIS